MILGEGHQSFASPGEALEHHGVKGMKWGVRKEKETSGRKSSVVGVDPVSAAIGAAYLAAILGSVYVTLRDVRREKLDSGKHHQKQNANVPWKKNSNLSKKMSVDELHDNVVKQVNPNYGSPGTKMNCRRCTLAYEMRRRGNDVQATRSHYATGQELKGLITAVEVRKTESGWGEKQIATPKDLVKMTSHARSEAIFSSLATHPEGARGELAVGWQFGGGHSMAWEIVNNKPVVFDTQTGKTYRDASSFSSFSSVVHDAAYTRTDNAKLNEDFLRRWMTNV